MDSVHRKALDTFVCITGASEVVGLQILQENGGDLNAAINAYFNTRDESLPSLHREEVDRHEYMEEDDVAPNLNLSQSPVHARGPFSVPLEQVSSWNQDTPTPDAALSLLTGRSSSRPSGVGTTPQVSHPREVRDIPIDWHDEADASSQLRPVRQPFYEIEDVTTDEDLRQGSAAQGIVSMDDDPPNPTLSVSRLEGEPVERHPFGGITYTGNRDHNLFAPQVAEVPISAYEDVNDVEEEMLLAAIEASKKEAEEAVTWRQEPFESGTRQVGFLGSGSEDDDLARAVSLSLKTAEREKASRKKQTIAEPQAHDEDEDNPSSRDLEKLGIYRGGSASDFQSKNVGIGQGSIEKYSKKSDSYSSSPEEVEEPEDQPLLRRRARCTSSNNILQPTATPTNSSDDLAEGVQQDSVVPHEVTESSQAQVTNLPQLNGGLFHADEWGGISSEEHDEAVMLEAALFGGLPESALLGAPYQTHRGHDTDFESSVDAFPSTQAFNSRRPYPQQPSPSVVAQRLLREQQDDEYLASLAADQEKEMKAMLEAEARRAEQEAAASADEKIRQEEERNRLNAVKELVRQLNAKKARLPPEPAADDESSVTLLVRLPDGSRRGRRFQKSDKLQSLFDFIDVNGGVNPGTYRLVRQYPRRAFNDDELSSSFSNLGLTNKQEALFLEMM